MEFPCISSWVIGNISGLLTSLYCSLVDDSISGLVSDFKLNFLAFS